MNKIARLLAYLAFSAGSVAMVDSRSALFVSEGINRIPARAGSCAEVFQTDEAALMRAFAIATGDHYTNVESKEFRASARVDGSRDVVRLKLQDIGYMDEQIRILSFEEGSPLSLAKVDSHDQGEGLKIYWQEAQHSLKFSFKEYRERRKHWSKEFLVKLRKIAKRYLKESTYISIFKNNKMTGTIRLIAERNGKLPLEEYLGVEIDTDGVKKVEPGNFAISKEYNQEIWPDIMMNLADQFVASYHKSQFITYADEYSKSLYSRLGFKLVPRERIKLLDGVINPDGSITKDGVDWTPMEASYETIRSLTGRHLESLQKRGHDQAKIELVSSRQKNLGYADNRFITQVSRSVKKDGRTLRAEWRMGFGSKVSREMGVPTYLDIYEQISKGEWKLVRSEYVGVIHQEELQTQGHRSSERSELSYSENKLRSKSKTSDVEIDLTIGKDLMFPIDAQISDRADAVLSKIKFKF